LSERAISDLERGLKQPQRATLRLLADGLGLTPEQATEFALAARGHPAASDVAQPGPPQHNLPAAVTTFVGRGDDIDRLLGLLAPHSDTSERVRLVTLTGPGGIGKTRLALEAGRRLLYAYSNSVRFVPLAAVRDPGLVIQAVAAALPAREESGRTLTDTL